MKKMLIGGASFAIALFALSTIPNSVSIAQTTPEPPTLEEPSHACVTIQTNPFREYTICAGEGEECQDAVGCR